MSRLKQLQTKIATMKQNRILLKNQIKEQSQKLTQIQNETLDYSKALEIIKQVALQTQNELEFHISSLVSMAMQDVFQEEAYELKLNFVEKRNKTEVEILFERNGIQVDPLTGSGGGAVDVASFALLLSLWVIQHPRTRNTIILDEPLKWLKGNDLPIRGAEMIKNISQKLRIQIIMVSHSPELIEASDKIFEVKKDGKFSRVTEVV